MRNNNILGKDNNGENEKTMRKIFCPIKLGVGSVLLLGFLVANRLFNDYLLKNNFYPEWIYSSPWIEIAAILFILMFIVLMFIVLMAIFSDRKGKICNKIELRVMKTYVFEQAVEYARDQYVRSKKDSFDIMHSVVEKWPELKVFQYIVMREAENPAPPLE